MRLSQIRFILKESIDGLKVSLASIQNSPNVTITEFIGAVESAKMIEATGILRKQTKSVLTIKEIVNSAQNEIVVHTNTGQAFHSAVSTLSAHVNIVLDALNEFIGEEHADSVCIKLPENKDLDKVVKNMATIKLALEQALVHPVINGHVELLSFERGSNWIELGIGGVIALNFLAGMLRLIHDSRTKEIEIEAKREMVRHLEMQNDLKEKVLEAIDNELEIHYSNGVGNLLAENSIDKNDPEYRNRLAHSLRLLGGLISQGLEVHPTLITSTQSDNFPDPQKLVDSLKGIEGKLIGNYNEDIKLDET